MSDDLVERLWASDEASALTNQAARRIEALEARADIDQSAYEELLRKMPDDPPLPPDPNDEYIERIKDLEADCDLLRSVLNGAEYRIDMDWLRKHGCEGGHALGAETARITKEIIAGKKAAEAERDAKREQILVMSRTTEALQERVEAQRVLIEDLKGDIRVAYLAGATAVHNEWLCKDYLPADPDFDEAAGDYATAVIHIKEPW